MPFFSFLEGIYICIYLQPCWYLHSQEYSVRNTKVLRKELLKISSRLQENDFHMVRPESPVLGRPEAAWESPFAEAVGSEVFKNNRQV